MARGQMQLLDAKATLSLRNSVVESAVAAQPTLNAVHRATHASPVERYNPPAPATRSPKVLEEC